MHKTRKCTRSKEASPGTTSGVRFSAVNVFPGYAKNAYPGLLYVHASGVASPKGCKELSPGWSVLCDNPGLKSMRENAPRRGCEDYLGQQCSGRGLGQCEVASEL